VKKYFWMLLFSVVIENSYGATDNDFDFFSDLSNFLHASRMVENVKDSPDNRAVFSLPKYDHDSEIERLKDSDDPNEILLLALLIHTYGDGSKIDKIAAMLNDLEDKLENTSPNDMLKPDGPYDGSDQSMISYLMHYSENSLGGAAYFTIPCAVLIERPELLAALNPAFGSNRDNFLPRADCDGQEYSLPWSVETYLKRIKIPLGGWPDRSGGSMRYAKYKVETANYLAMKLFPRNLLKKESAIKNGFPYEAWSMLNVENRRVYEEIKTQYLAAKVDLVAYYKTNFAFTSEEAERAAVVALWLGVMDGNWKVINNSGLRYQILENLPISTIAEEINAVDDLTELNHTEVYCDSWSDIGIPDPLIMMAVNRPNVLKLLLQSPNSFTPKFLSNSRFYSGSYSNPETKVNAHNLLGKTALLAAVQQNQLESVKILIDAGADLTSIVDGSLLHNKRTIAMYAAANADLELIEYLIGIGVDFSVVDSEGAGVLAYLLGHGALEANPNLTVDNVKEYIDILAPNFLSSGSKISPSYDCSKARNYVEKTVCGNMVLSVQDRMLALRYQDWKEYSEDTSELKANQISWMRSRNKCADSQCIEASYQQRLNEIEAYIQEIIRAREVEKAEGKMQGTPLAMSK